MKRKAELAICPDCKRPVFKAFSSLFDFTNLTVEINETTETEACIAISYGLVGHMCIAPWPKLERAG